jgi:tRNA pseudouridine38-40 synthase
MKEQGGNSMRNLLLTICYDGTNYHGWQIQQNSLAVQQVFQDALQKVLGDTPDLKGCSRTDSGVHAYAYCISLKTEHNIPCNRLVGALNHFLPADIAVLSCREVPQEFHARYSCEGKEYVYKIWNNPIRSPFLDGHVLHYWYKLDIEKLNEAAHFFVGSHDFTSFCTLDSRERGDMTRTVTKAELKKKATLLLLRLRRTAFYIIWCELWSVHCCAWRRASLNRRIFRKL